MSMNSEIESCLIEYFADEWRWLRSDEWATRRDYSSHVEEAQPEPRWDPLSEERWPWGVWMRLHDPLPSGASDIEAPTTLLRKAWFLSEDGLRRMNPWSFLRFRTVQFIRPWTAPNVHLDDAAFARPRWRIGYAAVAEITGSDEIYLETVWGGLWGRGRLVTIVGNTVQELSMLWIA